MEASTVPQANEPKVSISFDLPASEAATLKELADARGGNVTTAIRQALVNDKFVRDRLKDGAKILFQNSDGTLININWA